MFKRIALFLATNLAVLALVSIVMAVFGINPATNAGLLVMAALFGFGGSFISLLMSKWIAKRTTGAHVIAQPRNEAEQWLFATVQRQAQTAGIGMPEVAIYDAPEINAFATGANRNNALVAVSTGLLRAMNRDEAEAVLGARSQPRRQRRHGDDGAAAGRAQHVRDRAGAHGRRASSMATSAVVATAAAAWVTTRWCSCSTWCSACSPA